MPAIVEYPTVVKKALNQFGHLFANEPERRHFGEYLTGLMVAQRKTVSGINSEFASTTDQSCLNRFITQVEWSEEELNLARLQWLQQDPSTRFSAQGVIPFDNVLIDHEGRFIEDVGYFWDHADQRHLIAHDYLIINYVCTSGKHYPLEFRRFRKKEDCLAFEQYWESQAAGLAAAPERERRMAKFKSHTDLAKELIDWVVEQEIPGDFTMDSYFTNAAVLNHIQSHNRAYVGDLKFNRKLWFEGREMKAEELAEKIGPESRKPVRVGDTQQWYFTKTIRIPEVDHKVRIVILWARKNGKQAVKILVTNRLGWEVTRILRVYRRRWTGTETFHRDGKQNLGIGECQLRRGESQTRHMYLVILAYSLLMSETRQGRVSEWAMSVLTTIGEACRGVMRETMSKTINWAIEKASCEGWSHEKICTHLGLM